MINSINISWKKVAKLIRDEFNKIYNGTKSVQNSKTLEGQSLAQVLSSAGSTSSAAVAQEVIDRNNADTNLQNQIDLRVQYLDILDVLNSMALDKTLSANQGRVLKSMIDAIQFLIDNSYYTKTQIDSLVAQVTGGIAPGTLDSIFELAAALNNDPNFASGVLTALSEKIKFTDVIDSLTSMVIDKPLSANQGRILNENKSDIGHGHIDLAKQLDVDKIWSTGVVSGCDLTDNGDGTVSISTGVAMVRTSASASSPLVEIALPALSNQSFTDNSTNYIYYDKNSVWFVTQNISDFNGLDKVFAYKVSRAGVEVYFEDYRELNVDSNRKLRRVFRECNLTFKSTSGSLVSEIGTRNLAVSAGKFFRNLNYVSHSAFDSSIAGTSIDKVFRTYFKAGVNWVYFDNIKTLDNLQFNNTATGLVTLSNNYYVVHWIYLLLSGAKDSLSTTSRLVTVYSQAQYQTLADAQNSGLPASLPDVVSGAGVLLGRAIIQKSAVNTVSVQSAFSNTFSGSSIPPHESLVGLQGGQLGEYYHLTNGQYGNLGKVYNASSGQNLVLRSLILEIGSGIAPLLSLPNFIAIVGQSGAIQQTGISWNFMLVNDASLITLVLSSGAAGTSDGSATIYYLASA